jgi:hypothetical protein
MSLCEICGDAMRGGATYRAEDDAGHSVREFPAEECGRCGHIRPHLDALAEMDPEDIPSSVYARCSLRVA